MRNIIYLILFVSNICFGAGRLQNEDFKTQAQIISAGGSVSQLLNTNKIYSNADTMVLDTALTTGVVLRKYSPTVLTPTLEGPVTIKQNTTPGNPAANYNKIYFKSDDKLYKLNSAGAEVEVGAGSTGASTSLDNLATLTGINSDLVSAKATSWTIKTSDTTSANTVPFYLKTGDALVSGNSANLYFGSGSVVSSASNTSGGLYIYTAANPGGEVGDIEIAAGQGTMSNSGLLGRLYFHTRNRQTNAIMITTDTANGTGWVNIGSAGSTGTGSSGRTNVFTGPNSTATGASADLYYFTGDTSGSGASGSHRFTAGISTSGTRGSFYFVGNTLDVNTTAGMTMHSKKITSLGYPSATDDATNIEYVSKRFPLNTKGDLFTYSTSNDRLPLGPNGYILSVDTLQSSGLNWVAPASGFLSNWTSFTPTGSWTTNTTYSGMYRRSGDTLEVEMVVKLSGAPDAANLTVNIPLSLNIDSTKMALDAGNRGATGVVSVRDDSASSAYAQGLLRYTTASSTTLLVLSNSTTTTGQVATTTNVFPITFANNDAIFISYKVPISEWAL